MRKKPPSRKYHQAATRPNSAAKRNPQARSLRRRGSPFDPRVIRNKKRYDRKRLPQPIKESCGHLWERGAI